jgi:amidase
VAHASDGAGSIRIPAAWCGLVGLKPSRDRIDWRHAGHHRPDVEFVVARSLRDTARFLDLLRPAAARRDRPGLYEQSLEQRLPRLRIGLCTESPDGSPVHAACVRAVEATGQTLRDAGHAVEFAAPPTLQQYEERAWHGAAFGFHEYLSCLEDLEIRLERSIGPEDVEPFLWELAHLGKDAQPLSQEETERATNWLSDWERRTLAWFEDFDLLVTPTVCEPAPPLESLDPIAHSPIELLEKMVPHMAFTEIWNATGQPAISLPLGFCEQEALPIGVQLVAGPERDDLLLSLAALLLPTRDDLPRRPPFHA